MNENSKAIIILCSHMCINEEIKPFEPNEWSKLALKMMDNNIEPFQLLDLNEDIIEKLNLDKDMVNRINKLVTRSASIIFELNKYESMGIKVVTRADSLYPSIIKKKLKNNCPPIIYYCGNIELLNNELVGFVGSRNIDEKDQEIVENLVKKVVNKGHGIVSGGAKGVDETSTKTALENNGFAVEFIADSLIKKIKNKENITNIRNSKLLICSVTNPDAGFNVGTAMMRNKYIYTCSKGTIVVKSDFKKGGTWAGATENIKKGYSPIYCIKKEYIGNQELIKLGAIGIDSTWDVEFNNIINEEKKQLSLF